MVSLPLVSDSPPNQPTDDDAAQQAYATLPANERVSVPGRSSYFHDSRQPLTVLMFLLPVVLIYELGAWRFLVSDDSASAWAVSAQRVLASVFEVFGVAGLHLPAVLLVVVLLVWHVLSRQPWRVKPGVLLGMAVESSALAIPLIVLAAMMTPQIAAALQASVQEGQALTTGGVTQLGWPARATISLGAGLYEELLFRMIGIAALHFVLSDLLRVPERWGTVLAVVGSALAFALYHQIPSLEIGVFYFLAGAYFGLLYVVRGFGIVVACHAAYDLVALVIGPATIAAAAS